MVITHEGLEFFKVQYGDTVVAFNPISKASKFKAGRFGADIVLISCNHEDFNGTETVTFGDKRPFVVRGPGEYEYKGVTIKGFPVETNYGGEKRINTIYLVTIEGMQLCFLGPLDNKNLPNDINEALDDIDILFVPIGGEGVLSPAQANELAVAQEPKLVIPMHYSGGGAKSPLGVFLKESGEQGTQALDKLTLKKKDLEGKEGDVVVLTATH